LYSDGVAKDMISAATDLYSDGVPKDMISAATDLYCDGVAKDMLSSATDLCQSEEDILNLCCRPALPQKKIEQAVEIPPKLTKTRTFPPSSKQDLSDPTCNLYDVPRHLQTRRRSPEFEQLRLSGGPYLPQGLSSPNLNHRYSDTQCGGLKGWLVPPPSVARDGSLPNIPSVSRIKDIFERGQHFAAESQPNIPLKLRNKARSPPLQSDNCAAVVGFDQLRIQNNNIGAYENVKIIAIKRA